MPNPLVQRKMDRTGEPGAVETYLGLRTIFPHIKAKSRNAPAGTRFKRAPRAPFGALDPHLAEIEQGDALDRHPVGERGLEADAFYQGIEVRILNLRRAPDIRKSLVGKAVL